MKESDHAQLLFEAFADGFLRALLEGEQVQLTRLLGPGLVPHFSVAQTADSEVDAAIYARLHELASRYAPVRALRYPEPQTRAFAMGLHDLIALTDPLLDRTLSRRARPKIVKFVEGLMASTSAPRTRGEVLARHVICDRALALRRRDVVVTNWAYTYRFFGRPVPRNVVALPRLRFVKQKAEERSLLAVFNELDGELPVASLLDLLLERSPFTRLLHYPLSIEPLFDVSTLAILEDASLRQGLISELCEAHAEAQLLTRLGAELSTLRQAQASPRLLRIAIHFVLELGLRLLLGRDAPEFQAAAVSRELGLVLCLPAAALGERWLWPKLARADLQEAGLRAQAWAASAGEQALQDARAMTAMVESDLERAS